MQIRLVEASDYEALARIATAAFAGTPHFADELQEEDEEGKAPGLRFERWVAEVEGQVVSTVRQFAAISLRTFTREDIAHAMRYLEQRGFVVAKRSWKSALAVAAFDPAPFAGVIEQVLASGIAIRSIRELQAVPGWEHRYLDLYNAIQTDVPDFDPAAAVSFEHFQAMRLNSPRFLPEGQFIALDGDKWIGLCTLWTAPEPDLVHVGLTGVLPEYRRRRIALALKLRSVAFAREQGYRNMSTHNASTNTGMLAINNQLGFVREPAWVHLICEW
jgi:mycothiol synthase